MTPNYTATKIIELFYEVKANNVSLANDMLVHFIKMKPKFVSLMPLSLFKDMDEKSVKKILTITVCRSLSNVMDYEFIEKYFKYIATFFIKNFGIIPSIEKRTGYPIVEALLKDDKIRKQLFLYIAEGRFWHINGLNISWESLYGLELTNIILAKTEPYYSYLFVTNDNEPIFPEVIQKYLITGHNKWYKKLKNPTAEALALHKMLWEV